MAKKSESDDERRTNIIQFRADDSLMQRLQQFSDRLHIPLGILIRSWVIERLDSETQKELQMLIQWRETRFAEIRNSLNQFDEDGVVQIIHLMPLTPGTIIEPSAMQTVQGLLRPVERVDEWTGRINLHGFCTKKVFKNQDDGRMNGYVQLFESGKLESVRILHKPENTNLLYGAQLDDDLISATTSYFKALQQLKVPLPISMSVTIWNAHGFGIHVRHLDKGFDLRNAGSGIECNDFILPEITISKWDSVATPQSTAMTIRPILNRLWNAAGFQNSFSYNSNGEWLGPLNAFSPYA